MNRIDELAHELALTYAESAIDTHTISVAKDGEHWTQLDEENGAWLAPELEYLTLRGLLRYHPSDFSLVQIIAETAAGEVKE